MWAASHNKKLHKLQRNVLQSAHRDDYSPAHLAARVMSKVPRVRSPRGSGFIGNQPGKASMSKSPRHAPGRGLARPSSDSAPRASCISRAVRAVVEILESRTLLDGLP